MTASMTAGVPQADGTLRPEPQMDVADVARAVVYMASLPLAANVATLTVMATKMPYVGRGCSRPRPTIPVIMKVPPGTCSEEPS